MLCLDGEVRGCCDSGGRSEELLRWSKLEVVVVAVWKVGGGVLNEENEEEGKSIISIFIWRCRKKA